VKSQFKSRISQFLTHRYLPWILAGIAILLTLPALQVGLLMDDHFIQLVILQPENFPVKLPHPLDTYSFFKSDPEYISSVMEYGAIPWWINPEIKGCFWRPLTSITQFIDHRLWGSQVWLMHLQNILWYGALVLAAAYAFRGLMGTTTAAGLAALMFAVEEAHGQPAGWLANRNSVLACLFGVIALSFHHAWRKEGKTSKCIAALIALAAALLSAEAGLAAMAYIGAYALIMETGPWKKRVLSLMPYIVVIIIWRGIWTGLGYGVHAMPLYKDPIQNPWLFIQRVVIGMPQMITGQFTYFLVPEFQAFATIAKWWVWFFSAGSAVLIFLLFWPLIKTNKTARFFGLGAMISAIPFCSTIAQTRNFMFVGIGAFGLLALWFTDRPRNTAWPLKMKFIYLCMVLLHIVMAAIGLALLSGNPMGPVKELEQKFQAFPDMDGIEEQDLIIVNHPSPFTMVHYLGNRGINREPLPLHTRVLSQAFTPITLKRTSMAELHLQAPYGITDDFSRIVNTVSDDVRKGNEVKLPGMTIRVVKTNAKGLLTEAVFTFNRALEDSSFKWLWWSEGAYHSFTLPAVGETIEIPGAKLPFGMTYEEKAEIQQSLKF